MSRITRRNVARKALLFLIISALLSAHLLSLPKPALACSPGYPGTLEENAADFDTIVKATVQSVDPLGVNAVIQVSQYFKGDPTEPLLFVVQSQPAYYNFRLEYQTSGDCYGIGDSLYKGEEAYFLLNRLGDGSYRAAASIVWSSIFPIASGKVNARLAFDSKDDNFEPKFQAALSKVTGQPPQAPTGKARLPLNAPLFVKTANGTQYVLPIDGHSPSKVNAHWIGADNAAFPLGCIKAGCSTSPVGTMFYAALNEDDLVIDQSPYDPFKDPAPDSYTFISKPQHLPGFAFLFSPSTHRLLVWRYKRMELYGFSYPADGFRVLGSAPTSGVGYLDYGRLTAPDAAWSADEHWVAYTDYQGVWLWDVTTPDAPPRLILPVDPEQNNHFDITYLVTGFSPSARYLSLSEGDHAFTLDRLTGVRLPAGVFSPDERYLLTYRDLPNHRPEICEVLSGSEWIESCGRQPIPYRYVNRQLAWRDSTHYAYLSCEVETPTKCEAMQGDVTGKLQGETASAVHIQPTTGDVALLKGDKELSINGEDYPGLADALDSPIAEVRWLPALLLPKDTTYYYPARESIQIIQWSPDGKRIASSDGAGNLFISEPDSKAPNGVRQLTKIAAHDSPIVQIAWKPDSKQLATSDRSHSIRIWDAVTGQRLGSYPLPLGDPMIWMHWVGANAIIYYRPYIYEVAISEWRLLDPVTGQQTNSAAFDKVYDVFTLPSTPTLALIMDEKQNMMLVNINPDGASFNVIEKIDTKILTPERGTYFGRINVASYDDAVHIITFGTNTGYLVAWNTRSHAKAFYGNVTDKKSVALLDVQYNFSQTRFISIAQNGTLRLFDPLPDVTLYVSSIRLTEGVVDAARFSPDGKLLAIAAESPTLSVFEVPTGLISPPRK